MKAGCLKHQWFQGKNNLDHEYDLAMEQTKGVI